MEQNIGKNLESLFLDFGFLHSLGYTPSHDMDFFPCTFTLHVSCFDARRLYFGEQMDDGSQYFRCLGCDRWLGGGNKPVAGYQESGAERCIGVSLSLSG